MSSETQSEFDALAAFSGDPGQFWPRFRAHAQQVFRAGGSCVLIQPQGGGIRSLTQSSALAAQRVVDSGVVSSLEEMTDGALHEWAGNVLVMALPAATGSRLWLLLLDVALEKKDAALREMRMLAETYQSRRREQRSGEQVLGLTEVMDLGVSLGEITNFQDAALCFCHRLAALMGAARVSLGWMEGDALQLQATSHGGRVSTKSQEAEELVRAMDESADQNNEVAHPAIAGSHVIARAHKEFSEKRHGAVVLSVPVRDAVKHHAQGVLLLERSAEDGAWSAGDLERMRLAADLVAPRLSDLHRSSGWLGKRLWRSLRRRAAGLLGTEHTGWKLAVVLLLLTVVVLALVRWEHKVRAPFLLKTDAAAQSTAPFAGYIDEVRYHLGDFVKQGQVLVTLDRRELLLEEANALAGRDKNEREARAYEAQGKLAEALMAKSAQQQDEAKLAIVRHRLAMTEIRAPFDGIVVEGDLRERLSSPVQVGERLFKIVQVRDLLGQLQVDERDIGYLKQSQSGELAFASRPGDKFAVKIERFEPVAEVRQEGNVFVLRVKVLGEPQDWWRPGMSGVCKVDAGKRSLLWILTHRTIETLRMWLWV
jgi:biotin carboxyl carrier protein